MSSLTSHRSSLVFLAVTLLTFLAASSAPTPLYHLYQEGLHFSAGMLTLIFGVYALSLLAALLTVGSLSDHLGRKPVIFTALVLNMLAMLLFINESGVQWLIAARVMQGFATGMATSVLGAALLDTDRQQGPLVNSVAPLLGMACGAMGASALTCDRPVLPMGSRASAWPRGTSASRSTCPPASRRSRDISSKPTRVFSWMRPRVSVEL